MLAAEVGGGDSGVATALVERAYLVRARDVMFGTYPYAEPIVLIDLALVHRHPSSRILELLDTPQSPDQAPSLNTAVPLFVVDMREAALYEGVRPAVVLRDLRS
ncbi:MAG: hypothetical protein ACKVVP_01300 [Chloroflexota bacterium]